MSLRGDDWLEFSRHVKKHIEAYTVPQYGDKGMDICTNYTAEECLTQAKKYIERFGRNSREGQQELDFLKMAHFIQMAYEKHMRCNPKHDQLIDEIRNTHITDQIIPEYITPICSDNEPSRYRLFKDHHGEIHLQGYFCCVDGVNGVFEWRTIPTVTNQE